MHHIFVKKDCIDLDKKLIVIDSEDDFENYNHLVNSLRVKKNEEVLCSAVPFISTYDYKTKVSDIDKTKILLIIEEELNENELPVKINLYQGLAKSDKMEYIIEKAVELGVSSIIPLATTNAVVKLDKDDKKYKNKLDRYNKISKSAAEQSKRHIIPEVCEPVTIKETIENIKDDYNIVFYENAKNIDYTRKAINEIKNVGANSERSINIFIGPEGGFTDDEIEMMTNVGFKVLTLGSRILRTETAALNALSIFMYEFER